MLRLAAIALHGRRVLTIEPDYELAADMALEIRRSGGLMVGAVPGLTAASAVIDSGLAVDCAMLDTRLADESSDGLDALRRHGVELVFVTGYDEWFDDDEDETLPVAARA